MSEAPAEAEASDKDGAQEAPPAEFLPQGDAAFGQLMDALAPEEGDESTGSGEQSTGAAADGGGSAAPAAEAPAAGGAAADKPAAGDAGESGVPGKAGGAGAGAGGDGAADAAAGNTAGAAVPDAGAGDRPAEWTRSAAELTPKFGELSTQLEDTVARHHHEEALEAVKTEHARYFEELQKHPRLLVGMEVPSATGEGTETLRDAADAQEWQEAIKSLLVAEVRNRATLALEENSDFLTTVHQSIELFQNNVDLIPGTVDFDVELANKFATMMKPYELREEEKLIGYSIPVQPIINQLRSDLVAARAAAPASGAPAASASSNDTKPPAEQAPAADPPQAGIQSKAGNSSESEDFSTLFGTIGLPNLRI